MVRAAVSGQWSVVSGDAVEFWTGCRESSLISRGSRLAVLTLGRGF